MWSNYLKTAFRNLWKYKFYSGVNIFGLALGLTCFLFIALYVRDELSYDRYLENADRIYRVDFFGRIFDQEIDIPQVGSPYGPTVLEEFPEVEQQVRLRDYGSYLVRYEGHSFREENIILADSTFFEVFSLPLVRGEREAVLREPYTLVINTAVAKKYFGSEDPIGKSLILDNDRPYRVTGIMEPMPRNTHFNFDMLISMASTDESRNNAWTSFNFHTYLRLREGADPKAVEARFSDITSKYIGKELEQYLGLTLEDFFNQGNSADFSLFPLTDIHLHSNKQDELAVNSDIRYVYIFSFIGLFILLLACVNFMNLATARSAGRAREVGMRKVVGARRPQLILQFLSESTLLGFLALIIAYGLLQIFLPQFNALSGKELLRSELNDGWLWGVMGLQVLLVGLAAGSYPAFYLSGFRPISVLRGVFSRGKGSSGFRNALVVFQFVVTIALIAGTMIINNQLQFIQNKKLGFDRDQVLVISDAYVIGDRSEALKASVQQIPGVRSATLTSFLPTPSSRNTSSYFLGRNPEAGKTQVVGNWQVDHDYISTMGMEIIEGRNFRANAPADSSGILLNQAAVKAFNLDDPLGAEISTFDGEGDEISTYRVLGVVRDFHYASLRENIAPLVLHLQPSRSFLAMKVNATDLKNLIRDVEIKWEEYAAGQPFDYSFLDARFDEMYTTELRIGRIIGIFTILAVVIACLGLLGLATFSAEQRTREIGIRKILGAPISRLFLLLTGEFTKWVLLASLIALPLAYYAMRRWLEGFAYQTSISFWNLLGAVAVALLIALITVSYQAIRAARRNPVQALKR